MLHDSKTQTSRQRIEYSELIKTIKKKTRTEVRSFNTDMTKRIIEETKSTKAVNKFLMQGSKTIIATKRQDGTITRNKTEILSLATNFYRDLYQSQTKVEPIVHLKQIEEPLEDIIEEEVPKKQ